MKRSELRAGFAMLEFLIALVIGSMVMAATLQLYYNGIKLFQRGDKRIAHHRSVVLVGTQLERDFSSMTAFVPYTEIKKETQAQHKPGKGKNTRTTKDSQKGASVSTDEERKKVAEEEQKRSRELGLLSEVSDDQNVQYHGEKWPVTKNISFLTTTSLRGGFDDKPQRRLVRVTYELIPNKDGEGAVLWRTETDELGYKASPRVDEGESRSGKKKGRERSVRMRISDSVESIAFRFEYQKKKKPEANPEEKKNDSGPMSQMKNLQESPEDLSARSHVWSDREREQSATPLPVALTIVVTFAEQEGFFPATSYEFFIPVFAPNTVKLFEKKQKQAPEKNKKKKENNENKLDTETSGKPALPAGPGKVNTAPAFVASDLLAPESSGDENEGDLAGGASSAEPDSGAEGASGSGYALGAQGFSGGSGSDLATQASVDDAVSVSDEVRAQPMNPVQNVRIIRSNKLSQRGGRTPERQGVFSSDDSRTILKRGMRR